jgi:hypothetical protein
MILDFWPTIIFVTTYHLSRRPAHYDLLESSRSNVTVSMATSGCGFTPVWQFDAHNHANITAGDRSFLVHIPASYDPTTPHAVVLSFHGYKGNDLKQEKISEFSAKGIRLNGKVMARLSLPEMLLTLYSGHHCRLESEIDCILIEFNE